MPGKKKKDDIQQFSLFLSDNLIQLSEDLKGYKYQHGPYQAFRINDPKPRQIHKSSVRDRLLHHAVYRVLYPFFERTFISDSFSCRLKKGTHKAMARFRQFAYEVSRNHTQTCWMLKCDIRKFFENIHHHVLVDILSGYVPDRDIMALLENIIRSFSAGPGRGLPLGNLTSQLFVNVYMNEFDCFVKRELKVKYYIRYADDFVILAPDKMCLENILPKISVFLSENLKLSLHPDKVFIETIASGTATAGALTFYCTWRPLSSDGNVFSA